MFLFALPLILLFTGCTSFAGLFGEDEVSFFTVTDKFSVNVAYVNEGWPSDPTKLSLTEQEVLRTMGTPEMVHLWWDRNRPIVTTAEAYQYKTAMTAKFEPLKVSWIYLEKKKEVNFKKTESFETVPLSDKMRILCEMGDPNEIKEFTSNGKFMENWIYFGLGRIYRFTDDALIGVDRTRSVPSYGRN